MKSIPRFSLNSEAKLHVNGIWLLFYMSIDCRNMTMVVIDSIEKPGVHGFKAAKNFTNYGEPDTGPRVIFFRVRMKLNDRCTAIYFSIHVAQYYIFGGNTPCQPIKCVPI